MNFSIKTSLPEKLKTQCVAVLVFEDAKLSGESTKINRATKGKLSRLIKSQAFGGKTGESLVLFNLPNISADAVVLLGAGKQNQITKSGYQKIVNECFRCGSSYNFREMGLFITKHKVSESDEHWQITQIAISGLKQAYQFELPGKTAKKDKKSYPTKTIIASTETLRAEQRKALSQGVAIGNGINLARQLGNLPSNLCTPSVLARQASQLGKHKKVKTTIINKPQMEKLGMGALLAVSQGSDEPPKLITMEYSGGKKSERPVVLIGKGITFDTGGISLKPSAAMDEMKYDMSGAGSVLGIIRAISEMNLPINVVGMVAASENMPSGKAVKPGDVVKSMSGISIEILNTDAEGRLVLCDAICYARKYKPKAVIDIATLTGACVVALGKVATGLFSNHQGLASELLDAGEKSRDRAWQLPVWDDYQSQLKSNFADVANIGGRAAGSITAACFLERFAKELAWAHLDIAGTAWHSGENKGSTGRPVPLLLQYLMTKAGW